MIGAGEPDALAAIAAIARSVHGVDDSAALAANLCESVARSLGFDRVTLLRDSADDGAVTPLGAYPLAADDPLGADTQLYRRARETRSPVLGDSDRAATVVVVPLMTGTHNLGFLIGELGVTLIAANPAARDSLTALAPVAAVLLEKAFVHDGLMNLLRLKTEFIALASHELRTPAAAVCGTAATLYGWSRTLTPGQHEDLLRLLHEQAERLGRVVEQLLDLSRLEAASVRIKPVSLDVRERTEEIVRAMGGDAIEIAIDPALRVPADPDAFDHIVANLLANASRYGQPPITVSAVANDRHFRLVVEDRGHGVSPELVPRLFERFSRAADSASPGAGLGLSIAQAYAQAHGGQLAYTDLRPHGARFELIVPIRPAPGDPAAPLDVARSFTPGQMVWLNGRSASFCYAGRPGSAVIRYAGERETRVVPLRKLASAPTDDESAQAAAGRLARDREP